MNDDNMVEKCHVTDLHKVTSNVGSSRNVFLWFGAYKFKIFRSRLKNKMKQTGGIEF